MRRNHYEIRPYGSPLLHNHSRRHVSRHELRMRLETKRRMRRDNLIAACAMLATVAFVIVQYLTH